MSLTDQVRINNLRGELLAFEVRQAQCSITPEENEEYMLLGLELAVLELLAAPN